MIFLKFIYDIKRHRELQRENFSVWKRIDTVDVYNDDICIWWGWWDRFYRECEICISIALPLIRSLPNIISFVFTSKERTEIYSSGTRWLSWFLHFEISDNIEKAQSRTCGNIRRMIKLGHCSVWNYSHTMVGSGMRPHCLLDFSRRLYGDVESWPQFQLYEVYHFI